MLLALNLGPLKMPSLFYRKHNTEEAPSCCRSLFEALSGSLKVWEKYAESVPQPDYASKKLLGIDSLNKMWALIHHASVTLAEIMNSAECSEKINVEDVLLLTQVIAAFLIYLCIYLQILQAAELPMQGRVPTIMTLADAQMIQHLCFQ